MRRMPRPTSLTSYLKRVRWLWLTLRRIEKHSLRLRTKSRQLWTTLFSRIWLTWVGTLSSCMQLLWPHLLNCNRIMMFSRNRWLQTPLTGRKKWSTWFLHWRSTFTLKGSLFKVLWEENMSSSSCSLSFHSLYTLPFDHLRYCLQGHTVPTLMENSWNNSKRKRTCDTGCAKKVSTSDRPR